MVSQRINSCGSFRKGSCPHQKAMERAYLIPQLIGPDKLREYQYICFECSQCVRNKRKETQQVPDASEAPVV